MRTAEQVRAQQLKANSDSTASAVSSLPPSYIEGFKHTLDKYYRVTIGAGVTTVGGTRVSFSEDTFLRDADWLCAKNIGGLGSFYYVYLTKTKLFKVDRTAPQYSGTYYYQAHPTLGYRVIGKLWLDATDNQIKWCSSYFDAYTNQVTTAQTGYLGYADYYIDEDEDASILLQAANDYLSDAFSGGTNTILRGTYTTENTVFLSTNICFVGEGKQTIIKGNTVGSAGSPPTGNILTCGDGIRDVEISLMTIQNIETSASVKAVIYLYKCYNVKINECTLLFDYCNGIRSEAYDITITGNILTGGNTAIDPRNGIYCATYNKANISKNTFIANSFYMASAILCTNDYLTISENSIDGIYGENRTISSGISLVENILTLLSTNTIINCSARGIDNSGANNKIMGNTCYNNGDDTGIANANEDNYLEQATATGTYSLLNSWQQPVDAEPSVGTLHLIPEASRSSAWVLNGGTANTFTDVDFSAYVPHGVTALKLKWAVTWTGNGSVDYSQWELRKNGSAITDSDQLAIAGCYFTNLASGVTMGTWGQFDVLCDSDGIIEYRFFQGNTTVGALYLNIEGYYL